MQVVRSSFEDSVIVEFGLDWDLCRPCGFSLYDWEWQDCSGPFPRRPQEFLSPDDDCRASRPRGNWCPMETQVTHAGCRKSSDHDGRASRGNSIRRGGEAHDPSGQGISDGGRQTTYQHSHHRGTRRDRTSDVGLRSFYKRTERSVSGAKGWSSRHGRFY